MIAERGLTHVTELDNSFAGTEHEEITLLWVTLGSSDDLGQFFHVGRLDIDNIEAVISCLEIPEIDAKIISGDKSLGITVQRDGVDVIGMSASENASGGGRHHGR